MPRPALSARVRRLGVATLALVAVALVPAVGLVAAAPALAAGSHAPTPYAVTADGLTLPEGSTFADDGHVNVRYVVDGRQRPAHAHFEAKCITRSDAECAGARHELAQRIGERFLSWDAMGIPQDACITWVQMSAFNEHFGEGRQQPVCRTAAPAEPAPSEPVPSEPAPSEPAPSEPTPSEPTPSDPAPSEPAPSPTAPVVAHPQIQDYVGECDAAFVLDNRSSTVAVTYVINGITFVVPAGSGLHTDADGTRIQPIDGRYVITTDAGREWTFAARSCPTTTPAPSEPAPSEPAPSEPAPSEPAPSEPTPSEPAPSEPTPSEPAPSTPTPSEPAPSEPTPSEPTPSEPTPSEPTPSEPTPSEPTPSEPTPSEPGVDVPAVEQPVQPEVPGTPEAPSETDAPDEPEAPTESETPVETDVPVVLPEHGELPVEIGTPTSGELQADAVESASGTAVATTSPTAGASLPRTGVEPVLLALLLGALLIAAGAAVRVARR